MGTPRTYTVRGIDPTGPFTCQGLLEQVAGFIEIDAVPTESKAVELLLTHAGLSKMTTALPPVKSDSYVDVLNIKADVFVSDVAEAKRIRKDLAASIVTWAEKSRVRGVRGWRAHALKSPKVQRSKDGAGYELDFDAILGHAVFYNERVLSVGHTDDQSFIADTIGDLKRHLDRQHPGLIGAVRAEHAAKQFTVAA